MDIMDIWYLWLGYDLFLFNIPWRVIFWDQHPVQRAIFVQDQGQRELDVLGKLNEGDGLGDVMYPATGTLS